MRGQFSDQGRMFSYLSPEERVPKGQGQRYWPGLCQAVGRAELAEDPRFATDAKRAENILACVEILDRVFAAKTLAEWKPILLAQDGQWDVVKKVRELAEDADALANRFIQDVDYGDGRSIKMVSTPVQFDRQALDARPAPALGAHNTEVLTALGYDEDGIIALQMSGAIF